MAEKRPESQKETIVETRWNKGFEDIANSLRPTLQRWHRLPKRLVDLEPDTSSFFGVKLKANRNMISELSNLTWSKGDEFIVDFGIHMVGYLSFKLGFKGANMDAPCRLHLTFGESIPDVSMNMDNVKTWISTSWLPDETINIDVCPAALTLPRRYSFRYLRVRIIDVSPKYSVLFSDLKCECVSAVRQDCVIEKFEFQNPLLQTIDEVSIFTLRDCMQTVFEDGPRRDRRLWIGDLRLQALANYCTFKDYNLIKRCLYFIAAVARVDDSLPACVFEHPSLSPSTDYIVDYDALFATIVCDYVSASGDLETGRDLWPTVNGCLKRALEHIDPASNTVDASRSESWKFLDWAPGLDHSAGLHGLLIFSLKSANRLAKLLDKPEPYVQLVSTLSSAASRFLSPSLVFISGPASQISYASAAWLVLSQAFPPETARAALLNTLAHAEAVKPLTPYLWHHVCDALAMVGCYKECVDIIIKYWGGMVQAGADTFWECFDPDNPQASPYGDVRNNSFCHAWSCTPSYLLRGKLMVALEGNIVGIVSVAELDEKWISKLED
ncbi:hypothetical protein FQN55_001514 [Onygenales sp. PD_40]|nr:hypothetical protein FQN55_001514 [Onygenales sp. PD_40]